VFRRIRSERGVEREEALLSDRDGSEPKGRNSDAAHLK
jgi:hypothetical protein